MRVSIITPSYNQADYLEQTIRSVLDQGYPDLEYIIVDGGSTDGSVEIIRRYADRLAWWVSERDHGQADAINKGFRRATGEIVAWLNSDDYFLPGAISAAAEILAAHPDWSAVYGDVLAIDGAGHKIKVHRYADWGLEGLMCFRVIGQPSVFMRRAVLEQSGLLDESYHYLLDHEFWLRVGLVAPMHYTPRLWSVARYHAGAKNMSKTDLYGKDAYRIVEWMQSAPEMAARFQALRRKVWAGAYRIDGYYLSAGDQPARALRSYARSFLSHPWIALRDWQRIGVTFLALLGIRLRKRYQRELERSEARPAGGQ